MVTGFFLQILREKKIVEKFFSKIFRMGTSQQYKQEGVKSIQEI